MSNTSRMRAFIAYLLSVPGALYVLLAHRDDTFAAYHARQSLVLAGAIIATPLLWAACSFVLAWLPIVGAVLAAALFALVIAVLLLLLGCWALGMVWALQGRVRALPLVGGRVALPVAQIPVPEVVGEVPG
ncbi:MAG: hypothetical protein H7Y32_17770 [Chloroflexales bacterium]|nr:hypothetical protein [Chloroflexales bacterium]